MKKTIFIAGAGGFIGKNLSEKLGNKFHLLTPPHKELDLLDKEALKRFFIKNKIDIVINCAVVGGSRSEEYEKDMLCRNLRIFFNLANNGKHYEKMIFCGSGAEYDKSRPIRKIREENFDERMPIDDYGLYKYICSKFIEKSDNILNLRIFGLFGKYEDYRYRFISEAICRNIAGKPIIIKQNVFFDYVYIDDFVRIVEHFISKDIKGKFYNIGTGKKLDLLKIAEKINGISDKKSKIIIKDNGFNREYTCDNSRLSKELGKGFKFTSFDKSLSDLFCWYKSKNGLV